MICRIPTRDHKWLVTSVKNKVYTLITFLQNFNLFTEYQPKPGQNPEIDAPNILRLVRETFGELGDSDVCTL